ncbi:MAG TPA: SPOR domain-containing protein [Alcanivorax sp.]|nr:SPOR domain-containing protein [Alcanivorax sp.]
MRDEDFFYEGAERGDLLDALNGHAHEGATTALEGDAGSGVSTLLGMLSMSLVGDFELIRLDGAEELGANAVVDAMLVHFDIERADLADTLKQTLADTSLVIVVDNAHLAPTEALATMASLKTKLGQRLTYVFGGEPGSVERLRDAGLSVDDVLVVPPLDAEDVAAFADQGFALALDDDQAHELSEESDGRIAALLPMLEARAGGAGGLANKPVPWRHGLAVGALVLLVLVLWLASGGDDEADKDQVVSLDLPNEPVAEAQAPAEPDPQTAQSGADPESTRRALAEYHDSARAFEKAENMPEQADAEPAREDARTPPAPEAPEPAANAGDDASPRAPANPEPAEAAEEQAPATVSGGEPELSGLDARLGYRQEDWLATRDDGDWFLQLVATGREDGARGVLDQIDRNGAYYRAERGGEPVYLVLAGPYPSRDAALAARDELPEALRRGGPFPRDMASIRTELR